ncbi:hypothetical protein [Ralstonia sp. ASV6]|uniref:hypothetical protein n=1 Tax=Ralstonia sp. ASV6 TaxID=2795124 RepID=UPI0018EE21AA|nr:hypothetical protein [Ralstonia sp. ASV6]
MKPLARSSGIRRHKLPTGVVLLTDAEESALRTQAHRLASQSIADDAGEFAIAYGAYFPQVGVSKAQARRDIEQAIGHRLGYVLLNTVCAMGLLDVHLGSDAMEDRIPCAVLVRIDGVATDLLRKRQMVLAAFLRYANQDAATNILNRPGFFALTFLSPAMEREQALAWRELIHVGQVRSAATGIGVVAK